MLKEGRLKARVPTNHGLSHRALTDRRLPCVGPCLPCTCIFQGVQHYHIKWKNYPSSQNTYEPAKNIDSKDLIDEYWASKSKPAANKGKKKRAPLGGAEVSAASPTQVSSPVKPRNRRSNAGTGVDAVFRVNDDSEDDDANVGEEVEPRGRRGAKRARQESSSPSPTRRVTRKVSRKEAAESPRRPRRSAGRVSYTAPAFVDPEPIDNVSSGTESLKDATSLRIADLSERSSALLAQTMATPRKTVICRSCRGRTSCKRL